MPDGQVLDFSGLTKQFGSVLAVDGFSARVEPGAVTGFLGPNGAGKTTTLRILLGLVRASGGSATVGGVPYAKLRHPLRAVGAVLEASSFHPGRSAANHLKVYAQAAELPVGRVDEVLGTVGLADVAGRNVGGFSLGMRQRLGLAYALLGDPGVLVLDEPANGLDPEGIKWLRGLLRELARQGRTVLVSSHLLAEVQQTVDQLLVIARGRLVFQGALHELTDPSEFLTIVDAGDRGALTQALRSADLPFEVLRSGVSVRGTDTATVGQLAATAGIALTTLQRRGPALEEVFLELVNGARVHASAGGSLGSAVPVAVSETDAAGAEVAAEAVPHVEGSDAADERDADADDAAAPAVGLAEAGSIAAAAEAIQTEAPDVETSEAAAPPEGAAGSADVAAETATAASVPSEPEPETEPESDAAAPPAGAAFAVAATGVIDIVPRSAVDDEADTAEWASETEPTIEAESPSEPDPADEAAPESDPAPEGDAPADDETAPLAGDEHHEHAGPVESDVAADAFFAAFDEDHQPLPSDQPEGAHGGEQAEPHDAEQHDGEQHDGEQHDAEPHEGVHQEDEGTQPADQHDHEHEHEPELHEGDGEHHDHDHDHQGEHAAHEEGEQR